ncbi:hypothetical protein EYF80_043533 [Liparis tanakae]|uniref:Uncharacterized protein n=1 Tax=Liparis tanakae TaxID=230148 RepID=A0A4Z2G041_9TELE|nr:hypothetical protein EYF80_043533 [Liparis tanakae]
MLTFFDGSLFHTAGNQGVIGCLVSDDIQQECYLCWVAEGDLGHQRSLKSAAVLHRGVTVQEGLQAGEQELVTCSIHHAALLLGHSVEGESSWHCSTPFFSTARLLLLLLLLLLLPSLLCYHCLLTTWCS